MLTVRQALEMPIFATTKLVAGELGLDKVIRWVHTVDIPNASFDYNRPGILLLTSGNGLQNDPQSIEEFIPMLAKNEFAGVVFCTNYIYSEIPSIMIEQANELNFPLIESQPDLLFINISEELLEPIVNNQYTLLQNSNRIYDQLTELVLRGGSLADLTQTLAGLLNRSILIEDTSLKVLAHSMIGPMDPMRRKSVLNGRSEPSVSQRLFRAGIYDHIRKELKPMVVPPMPEVGMNLSRLIVPIVVDRDIYGYFWIISEGVDDELVKMAAGHGATVAALIMFKERAVAEVEAAARGDFFEQLISSSPDNTRLAEQARRLNFRLNQPHQVIAVYGPPQTGGNPRPLLRDVQNWFKQQGLYPLSVWYDEHVIIVLEGKNGEALAQQMHNEMGHPARRLLIGLGEVREEFADISISYKQALEALQIAHRLKRTEGVQLFSEMGLMHWLYHLPKEALEGNVFLKQVKALSAHDQRRNTELVKTLEGYLDNSGSLVETAAALHIHRNTLVHRLKRIEELSTLDLRDPWQKLNLHVAVKQFRLNGS